MNLFKRIFCAVLVFFCITGYAQDFATVGAKWLYTTGAEGVGNTHRYQFESIKDTIVLGKASKKIERLYYYKVVTNANYTEFREGTDTLEPYFVHQNADTVYLFNPDKQTFDKIYVFNVAKDDIITLDVPYDTYTTAEISKFRIVIDSVATETYGAIQLKKYKTRSIDDFGYGYDGIWYYDRIGSLSWFLPRPSAIIPEAEGPLICYQDNEISYPVASECDLPTGNKDANLQQAFTVYPNPAKDVITIQSERAIDKVEVYSIAGILIETGYSNSINIGSLQSGAYFLRIHSGKAVIAKPILVE